jgi:hypothetical protein
VYYVLERSPIDFLLYRLVDVLVDRPPTAYRFPCKAQTLVVSLRIWRMLVHIVSSASIEGVGLESINFDRLHGNLDQ